MTRFLKLFVGAITAVLLVMGLAACGSDKKSEANEITCIEELTPEQVSDIQASYPPEQIADTSANYNGTTDVCVIRNGEAHYYRDNDGLQNWMLYHALTGRGHDMLGYAMLTGMGDDDLFTAILLTNMLSVDRDGYRSRPYQYTDRGAWKRESVRVDNRKITNVFYGKDTKPVKYSEAYKKPKSGYAVVSVPKKTDKIANISSTTGTLAAPKVQNGSAKKELKGAKVVAPPAVKRVAPKVNVPNPNASVKPSPSVAPAPATKSTPSSKPTQSKPKATTPKKVTTKPKANAPAAPKPKVKSGR